MRIPVVILTLLTLGGVASAQDAEKKQKAERPDKAAIRQKMSERRPEMGAAMARRLPVMMALDVDKDGALSASEIENASKTLAKLDKNGDGQLSAEELRPDVAAMAREGMPGKKGQDGGRSKEMMVRMFDTRDTDGDGKLTGDEIPERLQGMMSRIDENSDGSIDRPEMEKAAVRLAERNGQRSGEREGKDGAGVRPKRPTQEEPSN